MFRARLGRLSPRLEQLYQEIYGENLPKYLGEVGQSVIGSIMGWLLCTQRQMKSSEFWTAVVMQEAMWSMTELTKHRARIYSENSLIKSLGCRSVAIRTALNAASPYS